MMMIIIITITYYGSTAFCWAFPPPNNAAAGWCPGRQ
jgi:hypothetical protein